MKAGGQQTNHVLWKRAQNALINFRLRERILLKHHQPKRTNLVICLELSFWDPNKPHHPKRPGNQISSIWTFSFERKAQIEIQNSKTQNLRLEFWTQINLRQVQLWTNLIRSLRTDLERIIWSLQRITLNKRHFFILGLTRTAHLEETKWVIDDESKDGQYEQRVVDLNIRTEGRNWEVELDVTW